MEQYVKMRWPKEWKRLSRLKKKHRLSKFDGMLMPPMDEKGFQTPVADVIEANRLDKLLSDGILAAAIKGTISLTGVRDGVRETIPLLGH